MSNDRAVSAGPLHDLRILELVGMGPAPYATLLLGDMGAQITRVARPANGTVADPSDLDPLNQRRPCLRVDLKSSAGTEVMLRCVESSDVLIEPFRPGVMERLGLGPETCLRRNPALVYARMTGWGQTGPMANAAGHDINYIALSGALHELRGEGQPPTPPLNLLGDFAGGSMFLIAGILSALLNTRRSGQGQVIDVAMLDGVASLLTCQALMTSSGTWDSRPGSNMLQGAAPFYGVYETADRRFIAVGAIEAQFYRAFMSGLGLDSQQLPGQFDRSHWGELRRQIAAIVASHDLAHWETVFDGVDACVTPILSPHEAREHPHLVARGVFVENDGHLVPAPAPRFSTSPTVTRRPPDDPESVQASLTAHGFAAEEIRALRAAAIIA